MVLAIALILGVGSCIGYVADGLSNIRIGREPLPPIAVPAAACPHLRPVHDLAVLLNKQWARALDGREPWPSFRPDLSSELATLETALSRAESHVPAPIASKFEVVVLDVHLGRAELPREKSAMEVIKPAANRRSPLIEGVNALADASDLVGNACGYRLAPSNVLIP